MHEQKFGKPSATLRTISNLPKPRGGRVLLVILGDGPCADELQAQIEGSPALKERAHLLGAVSASQVRRHMSEADLLILNSKYEGLSHVLLEAFDVGLPVIVAENPGNLELVGARQDGSGAGETFPFDDVDEMVCRIRLLGDDPERLQKNAEEARKRLDGWRAADPFTRLEERLCDLIES